ncbi:Di-copper centre-containing protein, partial [Conidiobolus coronatus NRRL 28638]
MNLLKLLLNTLIFSGIVSSQKCGRTLVRKEIREMSAYERKAFMNALTKLYKNKPIAGSKLHKLDFFGWSHTQMYYDIHQQPSFFPWHRYFLQLFQLMILQVDPTVVIPYWDWTKDSQEPHKSPVLTDAFYGSNGN